MTTLLLLRHSIPERGGSSPDPGLSAEGLQRAAAVFQNDAFRTVSLVWSSPSLRALQTAQLLGLPVRQDTRLAERRTGDTTGQDASFWKRQYEDPDFKNPDGESFREVRARMADCIHELLDSLPEGQNALVVSHAAAICSYLQRFCTVEVTDAAQKLRRITFQGEVLLDGHFWEADGFVLHIENRYPVLIRTIQPQKRHQPELMPFVGGASGSRTLAPVSRPIAFRVLPASQYSVEHSGSYPTLPEDTNHRDYAQNFIKVRKI